MILRSKPDFATSTPVSTQSHEEEMDVTQFIVDDYIHVEFEGIARHAFGPGEKNLVERGRKMVKIGETGSEVEYAPVWNQSWPKTLFICILSLTSCTWERIGWKTKAF